MTDPRPPLHSRTPSGRKRVNLRALPRWAQYVIALTTVVIVVALAWHVGKDNPVPSWITGKLLPILGWTYIALVLYILLFRLFSGKWPQR